MSDTPGSAAKQQQEGARFRSATSEALLQGMQANINYLLAAVLPIGSVIHSMLTEAQFQELTSDGWVLADGQDVSGSDYAVLTGFTTVPDMRGIFLRGKNNGRSGSAGNPDGDVALGTGQTDQFKSHSHSFSANITGSNNTSDVEAGSDKKNSDPALASLTIDASGGDETRPRNVTVNIFIRIN